MSTGPRRLPTALLACVVMTGLAGVQGARALQAGGAATRLALPASPLSADERILHALNRLGYGPRPADPARVKAMGLAAYLESQLRSVRNDRGGRLQAARPGPAEAGPHDPPWPAMAGALAKYTVLEATTAQLLRDYPRPTADVQRRLSSGEVTRRELREMFPADRRPAAITAQLQAALVTRAVLSEAQLEERLAQFWFNHFNVYAQKGAVRWMVPAYEREAIRPHVLGRFRDLVLATARHPAMLFYLDNWLSTRADLVVPAGPNAGRARGLNENYARELMELHTLGVDGGYTQQDVTEVARAFTGWTIDRPREDAVYVFRPRAHDQGEKRVLGQTIPAGGGERDGERVVDILVRHPSTARFIATKLARHFVQDDPPAALVSRMAAAFQRTGGDIRAVMTTLVTSPEFWARDAHRAKIKTPFDVVVSAVRTLDGRLVTAAAHGARRADGGLELAREVGRLGQPLYEAQAPTGYPDRAESWVNTGALLGRMNFALSLAHNRFRGVLVPLDELLGPVDRSAPADVLDRLLTLVLHGAATPQTRSVLAAQLASPEITRTTADDRVASDTDAARLAALVLGSPEFQRR